MVIKVSITTLTIVNFFYDGEIQYILISMHAFQNILYMTYLSVRNIITFKNIILENVNKK